MTYSNKEILVKTRIICTYDNIHKNIAISDDPSTSLHLPLKHSPTFFALNEALCSTGSRSIGPPLHWPSASLQSPLGRAGRSPPVTRGARNGEKWRELQGKPNKNPRRSKWRKKSWAAWKKPRCCFVSFLLGDITMMHLRKGWNSAAIPSRRCSLCCPSPTVQILFSQCLTTSQEAKINPIPKHNDPIWDL